MSIESVSLMVSLWVEWELGLFMNESRPVSLKSGTLKHARLYSNESVCDADAHNTTEKIMLVQ